MAKVTFLGTSAGIPTPDRGLPAVIVEVEGELVLFDCGEGTQRQMLRAGLSLGRRMKVFITHLHGDHLFGLPGLVQSMGLLKRVNPLDVYGPPGIRDFIEDTTVSTMSELSFELNIFEVTEGKLFGGRVYSIEGVWADHTRPAMAYRLTVGGSLGQFMPEKATALGIPAGPLWKELKEGRGIQLEGGRRIEPAGVLGRPVRGRVLVYSGDTRPCLAVERLAAGADFLIHESTFTSALAERAERDGHSTAQGAALLAARARVAKLVLTHISARYTSADEILSEAREVFVNTDVASDLDSYVL